MTTYNAGSVTAKIELDTTDFNKELESLKTKVDGFKKIINETGIGNVSKNLDELQKKLKKQSETINDYKNKLKTVKEENNSLNNKVKELSTNLNKQSENLKKVVQNNNELAQSQEKVNVEIKKGESELDILARKREKLNKLIKEGNLEEAKYAGRNKTTVAMNRQGISKDVDVTGWRKASDVVGKSASKFHELQVEILNARVAMQMLRTQGANMPKFIDDVSIKQLKTAGTALATFERQLKGLDSTVVKYKDGMGKFTYNHSFDEINQSLSKQHKLLTSNERASKQYFQSFNSGSANLNTYLMNSQKIESSLKRIKREQQQIKASKDIFNPSLKQLSQAGTAFATLERQLKTTKVNLDTVGKTSNTTSNSFRRFSQGMNQSAHSGRILSNTLYQMRGALLSLKMIFTAMGGMALWGFASQLAEGVKETFRAKNEMMAQLNQNTRVDSNGITYFNEKLDEMTDKFKKINKYSIGETVSSIGLEFNLNAKQMAESLDIVSMIQSEYVRAGRKEEEAALAVKDILQGEFQRLSRETGVGKEELVGYGWNEDKTDLDSLLKALRKAALDRHWDIFAAKANSLNDVMTITQSRFSEAGADLMQSATPMIVGAFNGIIEGIDKLQNSFGSLNAFQQNSLMIGGGVTLFGGILTALPMVIKGMGLADIATIGWRKSIATATLNLNKNTVAQYGFRKALAEVITGTEAWRLQNVRSTKAIMGRILGVNQAKLAEKGYGYALVHSKALLREGVDIEKISMLERTKSGRLTGKITKLELTRSQRLAYLTNNIKISEAAELSRGKALLKTATSWKVLSRAMLGIAGVGVTIWLAGLSAQLKKTKEDIDGFHKVVGQGKDMLSDAKKTVTDYETSLSKITDKNSDKYKRLSANLDIAKGNVKDLETATKNAAKYDKLIKQYGKSINEKKQSRMVASLKNAGLSYAEATERASGYTSQVEAGYRAEMNAYKIEDKRLYQASQHINEKVNLMKQESDAYKTQITDSKEAARYDKQMQKNRIKYVQEYGSAAEQAAEHWKQFWKCNFTAGFYAIVDELRLIWIDLWNNTAFQNWWKSAQKTWEELKPVLYSVKDGLIGIGEALLNFFSTDAGRWIGTIGLLGTGIGLVGLKIAKWVTGDKSVFNVLKKVGGKLKDVAKNWKQVGKNAEEASEKTTTSTGGINGGVNTGNAPKNRGEWWQNTKGKLYNDATTYVRSAAAIAAGMLLISEAVLMMTVPMWSLSQTGKYFKSVEPNVREGIEGLKLVSPVIMTILPPVITLSLIMDKYAPTFMQIVKGTFKAAVGIAAGMLLVAETITMIIPSIWALGALGDQYSQVEDNVHKGTEAMKTVSDSLMYLAPFIPALGLGVATVATAFANPVVGAVMGVGLTLGIPIGMLWVAETIWSLEYPLQQIGSLGDKFSDLSSVKKGSEVIKVTAEALTYVEDAMKSFAEIKWAELNGYIADIIGGFVGVDLTQLTGEGGFFSQLETFVDEFNKVEIEEIDTDKVNSLSTSATGISSVKTALQTVKDALKDLPNFEVDNRTTNQKYQDNVSGATSTEGITNYFEQLKQPIEQLNSFIKSFNEEITVVPVDTDKIQVIQQSANAISSINTAIEAVKTAVGNSVDTQWNANVQTSGILGAGLGLLIGNAGQSSGIKAGLDELYNSVKDIMDFNTRIAGLTSEGSGDTSSIQNTSNMVSALQTQINNLKTTLKGAVPTVKSTAKGVGSAIVTGVKSGMSNLSTTVSTTLQGVEPTFKSKGETFGTKVKDGFKTKFKIKDIATTEITNTLTALDGKDTEFYQKGYDLGDAFQKGYKDGGGIHSPGYAALAMQGELGYMEQFIGDGMNSIPQKASELANSVASYFSSNLNLGNIQLPDTSNFLSSLNNIPSTVTDIKTRVSTDFDTMKTNVGTSFTGIVSKTKLSLSNMQSQTTKNIGHIKTSWKGMQTALINSAEYIKTQTGQKIDKLKTNLGDFWNKIKHPDQLIGSAGGKPTGSIRRRGTSHRSLPKANYAGTGLFRTRKSRNEPSDFIDEIIKCQISTGSPCYAGWNFNWTNKIKDKFNGWNTHFGKYNLDSHLNVGKFNNSNFPVKGQAQIAKDYISDVIKSTTYDFYFNQKYGTPADALRAGSFNCFDGTRVILALAEAFGFTGGGFGHGTWSGTNHVWANIPGLGIIDPTAIQRGYGFKSPKVKGYSAGSSSIRRGGSGNQSNSIGDTHNEVHVHINGDVYGVDDLDRRIQQGAEKASNKLFRKRFTNNLAGV